MLRGSWEVALERPRPSKRLAGRPEVVAPEAAMIPDVKLPVGHHGVSPGFFHLVGALGLVQRREASLLAIGLGRRLDQRHIAVLAVQVKPPAGVAKRSRRQGA